MVIEQQEGAPQYSTYVPEDVEKMRAFLGKVIDREKVIKTEWLDKTKDIFTIYEGGKSQETPFNILYSNTEVLVPNLFTSVPKPVVRRRFGDNRADEAALAAERMVEYCIDTNLPDYPSFTDCIESVVLAAALPGQGQARIRLVNSIGVLDYVQHDQFIWAYAKRWEDTPWIAYAHDKTHEEIVAQFKLSPEAAKELVDTQDSDSSTKDKGPTTIRVYEVWRKSDKKVLFLCNSYQSICLMEQEDPLGLNGFLPSGKPLRLLSTPISTMPRATYDLYRAQAEELNVVTARIKRVAQAIQVKGIYDGTLPEMANLFNSGDVENSLTPASNPGGMAREGGLDRHIWIVPIEKFVVVLQQLFQIRESIKSTIYEILGIGDILRGVSAASETASAQQIKDKWGSLRIKKSRERVSEFVRFYIRALVDVSAKHTPENVWAEVTGMELGTQQQLLIAQATGTPPPEKSWEDVLGVLRSDAMRSYVIDIETNSTVDADATEDKKEITEFLTAIGQATPALQGIASQGDEGHKAASMLLIEVCKRFQMGGEVQRLLLKMKPQGNSSPEMEEAKKELETQRAQLDAQEQQLEQQKTQMEQQQASLRQQTQTAQDALRAQSQAIEDASRALQKQAFEIDMAKQELELKHKELTLEQKSFERARLQAPPTNPKL